MAMRALLRDLNAHGDSRKLGLSAKWAGPVDYDPLEFVSPILKFRLWEARG
jgi:hypothetical protein